MLCRRVIAWTILASVAWPAQGALRSGETGVRLVGSAPKPLSCAGLDLGALAPANSSMRRLETRLLARGAAELIPALRERYYTDALTGLPNRAYLNEHGAGEFHHIEESAAVLLDMNNFGAVNDALTRLHGVAEGRARADRVLAAAGAAFRGFADASGVRLARQGGEEFVVFGPRGRIIQFVADARASLTPGRLLQAAGIDDVERREIDAVQDESGKGGQPVADFTYGVDERGRNLSTSLKRAEAALKALKGSGLRGRSGRIDTEGKVEPVDLPEARMTAAPALALGDAPRVEDLLVPLAPSERALFLRAVFKDPLTFARKYDYLDFKAPEWNRLYASGGAVALISARNLKQINDALGYDAGDRYLRRLGLALRREINRARREGLDVAEPVRVASKEFLLIGRDAATVAGRVSAAFDRELAEGTVLPLADMERLRTWAVQEGKVPAERAALIGALRLLVEPFKAGHRSTDVKAAMDRAFNRLERQKRTEDKPASR